MDDRAEFEDEIARLRLIRTESIGPVTFWQLLIRFGSAAAALEALPELAARGGGRKPVIARRDDAEREHARVMKLGGRYLFRGMPAYPALLAESEGAPPVLIAKGRADLLERTSIAMVGARNASAAACRFARSLAQGLGTEDVTVVSGLARGIDSAAHDGALATGTVAVVAGGVDIVYPPENAGRQEAVGEQGLLLSEQPPGLEPRARHFPARNRIIAGIAQGTVVIEAALRSGSLITARFAAEFGRDVMAVPGSPLDPRAQGCNQLIRDGAILIQNAGDIVETVNPFQVRPLEATRKAVLPEKNAIEVADSDRTSIMQLLGPTPVFVDEVVRQSSLAPATVQTLLLELELAGRLERHAGGA
jgi:DNA processing protein